MALKSPSQVLVLDGPTGTELIARGFKPDPVLWTARAAREKPKLLFDIHSEYVRAGADIVTANTFRSSPYAAAKAGIPIEEARRLTHASLATATEAIEANAGQRPKQSPKVFLAGSLAPLEDCYRPELTPPDAKLKRPHLEMAGWLAEAGCDLILVETMPTLREARAAVEAAVITGVPVAVSFIPDDTGRVLLGGDDIVESARLCLAVGAECVLVNCAHPDVIEKALTALQPLVAEKAVIGAYANSARRVMRADGTPEWVSPESEGAYAERAARWVERLGARIIGSCCGTNATYTNGLVERLKTVRS